MGYTRRPSYYKDFRCIASDCTENCCIGWEIDVDEQTLAYYKSLGTPFSERVCAAVAPADEGESAHFILDERERCPFLNERNLCEVYLNLGEEHMAQICTDHPRYYEWFAGGREDGVGLCCEAAAELILQKRGYPQWDVTGEADEAPDELEQALFAMRDRLFAIVKPETPLSFDEKLDRLHLACCAMQSEYDDLLFPVEGEDGYAAEDSEDVPFRWSKMFWSEACLKALAERLAALEINKDSWRTLLGEVHARIPELLARRADFLAYYKDKLYEYDELLEYFLYRHFMKTLADDVLIEKVQFALIGASFIQLLDIYRWLTDGELTHWEQICICKAYSREIEYNEDNTEAVARFLTMD